MALGCQGETHLAFGREYEKESSEARELLKYDGVLIPGGFGSRGIEGKLKAIQYARVHKIPYFGLCYGMQLMTIEYARNVLGFKDAHTVEVNEQTKHPIIDIMPDQKKKLAVGITEEVCVLGDILHS